VTDREHFPDILSEPNTEELLHTWVIQLLDMGERSEDFPAFHTASDENSTWRHWDVSKDKEREILGRPRIYINFLYENGQPGTAHNLHVFCDDEFEDASGLGLDADGNPAELIDVDSLSQLRERSLVVEYQVVHPNNLIDVTHRWEINYEAEEGFSLAYFRGADIDHAQLENYRHAMDDRSQLILIQVLSWTTERTLANIEGRAEE